ncbi:Amino Acid/Auxin Permease (AAAP) Family [Phytophthora cinnamomi]|uniref:Amino Acid/Auxin Permease (AAAP) Family n=1 Tax=Phytophthora cinnamomi TaxID=4785 RepID=UPI00355AB938|nr:Amino Acid/Auxin Permease (AAAP) Family [Phytophthora cinnamomi]
MEFKEFRNRTAREPNTSPYPPMDLTPKEKDLLRQLAKDLVAVNVEEFEEFLFDNNGVLPEHQWEFVRRDEQVETFLRRREKYGLRGFGATKRFRRETSDTSASMSSTKSDELTSLDVADIRSVGFKDGTIEDGVYGAMSPTTEVFRTKSAYVDDKIEECNVLALIDNVTAADPFTSLTIRWRVTENPPVMRTFLKSYDHIYLEATGFTTLSNGDRVSYQLLHSIDFPHLTPPLSTHSRGQVAGILFFRQIDQDTVQIHGRAVFAIPFERARALFTHMVLVSMSKSCINIFFAAHMKKLRWAIQERRKKGVDSLSSASSDECRVCQKKPTVRKGCSCMLCGEFLCKSCRVSHKIADIGPDNKLYWTKVHVCPFCMTQVIKSDTTITMRSEIAAGEYPDRDNKSM